MNKKIILTFVLLIFMQQEFYGMKENRDQQNIEIRNRKDLEKIEKKDNKEFWKNLDSYFDYNRTIENGHAKGRPKLWLLWVFIDNVPLQYGNSKIWKYCKASMGLSNDICFRNSFLNFKWLKIGIIDAHINVINTFLRILRICISEMASNNTSLSYAFKSFFAYHLVFGIHLLSFEIFKCVKIRFTSIIACIVCMLELIFKFKFLTEKKKSYSWYVRHFGEIYMSNTYMLLAPRIEINISEIINYFRKQ